METMIRIACLGDICLEHKDLVGRSWTEPGAVHHTVEEFVRGVDFSIATLENPLFGKHLRSYQEGRGLTPMAKMLSIASVAGGITFSIVYTGAGPLLTIIMIAVAAAVILHILSLPNGGRGPN